MQARKRNMQILQMMVKKSFQKFCLLQNFLPLPVN